MFYGIVGIYLFIFLAVIFTILIFYIVGLWNLFKKAGRSGWEAIIPFYNVWVLADISEVAWWYPLIIILSCFGFFDDSDLGTLLSIASLIAYFFVYYNLSKKLHKETGFAILMTCFPIVMIPIVGLSSSICFDKDVAVSENGPIGDNAKCFSYNDTSDSRYTDTDSHIEHRYCQYCGKPVSDDAKYCGNCGNEIKK